MIASLLEGSMSVPVLDTAVDLCGAAVSHLDFLQTVDQTPQLYSGPLLKHALWRYGQLWLPLAAEHPDEVI